MKLIITIISLLLTSSYLSRSFLLLRLHVPHMTKLFSTKFQTMTDYTDAARKAISGLENSTESIIYRVAFLLKENDMENEIEKVATIAAMNLDKELALAAVEKDKELAIVGKSNENSLAMQGALNRESLLTSYYQKKLSSLTQR